MPYYAAKAELSIYAEDEAEAEALVLRWHDQVLPDTGPTSSIVLLIDYPIEFVASDETAHSKKV